MKKKLLLVALTILITNIQSYGQDDTQKKDNNENGGEFTDESFLDLSLEELMNLTLTTGNLTGLKASKNPLAITVIGRKEIDLSPAKNIYDLIEVYVPGLDVTEHTMGQHPSIRGFSGVRNDKFLLLVNGKLMNDRVSAGAVSELGMWDLDDIEKIEVIRGPGSITYGPGAIAGVISLTTIAAGEYNGVSLNTTYVAPYGSKRASFKAGYSDPSSDRSIVFHGSIAQTEGTNEAKVYGVSGDRTGVRTNFGYGYIGDETSAWDEEEDKPTHLADNFAGPQIKLFLDAKLAKNWRFWSRYTEGGSSQVFGSSQTKLVYEDGDTTYHDRLATSYRQSTNVLENTFEINDKMKLTSSAGLRFYEFNKRVYDGDVTNRKFYGDREITLKSVLNYNPNDRLKIAGGFEVLHSKIGPGWGADLDEMVFGGGEEIVSDANAEKYEDGLDYYFVGDGISSMMYSVFGEANVSVHKNLDVLLSARFDDHEWASPVFSPKVAFISELTKNQVIKVYWQRSARYLNSESMYIPYADGNETDPEILNTYEILHSILINEKLSVKTSAYYNSTELIGTDKSVSGGGSRPIGSLVNLGKLNTYGFEIEVDYKTDKLLLGANHAINLLDSWNLGTHKPEQSIQGISYSDYDYNYQPLDSDGIPYLPDANIDNTYLNTGIGNSINNIPVQSTKIFAHYDLTDNLVLHMDSRINWKYQGYLDGLEGSENAANAFGIDTSDIVEDLEDRNAGGIDIRLNFSASYTLFDHLNLYAYLQNIPVQGADSNKRYFYSTGETYHYPVKNYMLDVFTYSFKVEYNF